MNNTNNLKRDLAEVGIGIKVCEDYGRGSVLELDLQPKYKYSKDDLKRDLDEVGIGNKVSEDYGRGSVLELDLQPKYKFYVSESNISPCFWNVTKNVMDSLVKNNEDFALVLMDTENSQVYIYDKKKALVLLSNSSYEKKYGNYRITDYDVTNPVKHNSFFEFLTTLQ